jgi:DNA-binding transcriptional LysR family regulator
MDRPQLLDGRLKIRHLVYIDALASAASMAQAAERLHVTQPVVTRTLQDLEAVLGVPLFERSARGITPTVFGAAFTDHARAVLAQLRVTAEHMAALADGSAGTVTVGTHLAGSNLLLPLALARLKRTSPRVTVVVREGDPESLAAGLLAGAVDLIVGRLTGLDEATRLRQEPLYAEPVRLVAREGHPALGRPGGQETTLADLMCYPWVVPVTETALRRELEGAFLREGLALPADRVECTHILTTRHLLLHSDAIGALPGLIAEGEPGLAPLPVALPFVSSAVGITEATERAASPATRALADCLRAVAAELRGHQAPPPPPPGVTASRPTGR